MLYNVCVKGENMQILLGIAIGVLATLVFVGIFTYLTYRKIKNEKIKKEIKND